MTELARRCEEAEGPSRELDADIALTQGWHELPGDNWCGPRGEIGVPTYTASIDAAMSLVPSNTEHTVVFWQIGNDGEGANPADYLARILICSNLTSKEYRATAATPALALCSAALRAGGENG